MSKLRFSTVLLDADETVFDFLQGERISILATAKLFNIDVDDEDAKVYSSINASLWKELELGTVTRDELKILRFQKWFDYLGVLVDPVAFGRAYEDKLSESGVLFDDAEGFVKRLSELCRVYIVTNGLSKCQHGRMDTSPIKKYISGLFISEETGYAKPDKRFFDCVFSELRISDTSQVIILGDSLSSDMQGGRNAGIATCRYIRGGEAAPNPLCDYVITDYEQFFDILVQKS